MNAVCPTCGRALDEHNRDIRFGVPEPVLSIPKEERAALTWGNDVLMAVKGIGGFVRILVPVKLTGGYTVTYGAWLSVDSPSLQRAWELWTDEGYKDLKLNGVLANMLPVWEDETFIKPIEAAVINVEHVPYAIASSDEFMSRVLNEEWPHEVVLAAIAPFEGNLGYDE